MLTLIQRHTALCTTSPLKEKEIKWQSLMQRSCFKHHTAYIIINLVQ